MPIKVVSERLGHSTRCPNGFGEIVADTEPHLGVDAGLDELVCQSRRIGAGHDLGHGRIDGQLGKSHVEHGDVIGSGVRSGVTRSQDPGQCFTGGVQERQQRMEPEPALVRRSRTGLVRMRGDQRRVEIDHVELWVRARCPHPCPRRGSSCRNPTQCVVIDGFQGAPSRRCRRHLTEQIRLIAQHRKIRDRSATIGDHHRQIGKHPTPIVTTPTLLRR